MYIDAFSRLHPLTIAVWCILLFCSGAFTMHPCFVMLSLLGSVLYAVKLSGRAVFRKAPLLLFTMMIAACVNILFNHRGVTVLAHFPSGNPLTLEALLYGAVSALEVGAVIIWFYCIYKIFSSDSFMQLTASVFPSLTLVLSMTFRFIPLLVRRFGEISAAQKQLGHSFDHGSVWNRLKALARIFSILITRTLEESVETADSMKSRGYGLPGRTSHRKKTMKQRDVFMLVITLLFGAAALTGAVMNFSEFRFYPKLYISALDLKAAAQLSCFALLCLTPTIYDLTEDIRWRSFLSKL
ncbi:MAG: energy-coupling factor transporter transmembrane protein EcfT [Ruminococcus sp.]|nr:energy-coupling factor transporter transmembrane protein EcfT [Ruminococcus sp.]